MKAQNFLPSEYIEQRIYLIRNQKVMLDFHLAKLYHIPTKRPKEQVRRNLRRFPKDFMFELSKDEHDSLRSQIATSKGGRGGIRYVSFAFTEQGIAMLASVPNFFRWKIHFRLK